MFGLTASRLPRSSAVGTALSCLVAVSLLSVGRSTAAAQRLGKAASSGTIALVTSEGRTVLLIAGSNGAPTRIRPPIEMVGLQIDLSKDGREFATAGRKTIWTFSRSGREPHRVVITNGRGPEPPDWVSWAPTGKELAFSSANGLFRVSAQGGRATRLLRASDVFEPSWSSEGNQIVFVRNQYLRRHGVIEERPGRIQIIRPDGSGLRTIVDGNEPDIAPGGTELAFSRADGIYTMQIAGGTPRRVMRRAAHPKWSPDGNYLAFTRNVSCNESGCFGRVFIMSLRDRGLRVVGPPIFDIGPLSWSPR